jgi:sulfhydrogenase subunit beta (sulfur reductase)
MLDRVILQDELLRLVDDLSRTHRIVGPVKREDHFFYESVDRAEKLDLGFSYAVYSPKRFLFPAHEALFTFRAEAGSFEAKPVFDDTRLALVGVHPCDINAIRLLDAVFEDRYPDEHYLTRRRNTFIIGVDCREPCTGGVFCRDMKANHAAHGFDVMCCPLPSDDVSGDVRYGVVFGTEVGREWLLYSRAGKAPTAADERSFEHCLSEKQGAFPPAIPYDVDSLPELLDRSYDSLLWQATARRCYSCGSCNLSCPTCYCFNVYDELDMSLTSGERRREWDGCQLKAFAVVAGNHNFRAQASSRLRHRIYRKAKWVRERVGLAGCVGCARCDRACSAKINSVEIYNQLAEEA